MRILFVASNIQCPGTNGGSTHVTEVVTHLRERDEVLLIARDDSTLEQTLAVGGRVPGRGRRQPRAWALAARIYPEVRRFAPHVIYERGSSFGLGAVLGRMLGVPTLCMILDDHRTRLSLATASRIIATRADLVPDRYRAKLRLVSWGANTRLFHPEVSGRAVRTELGIPAERLVVGYTGAFYHWHGLEELVDAAATLGDLPVTYLLVGDGEVRSEIETRVAARGLQSHFRFTGAVPYARVPEYVAACDVCTAPYEPARHQHFGPAGEFVYDPLKIFEYMAAGRPVVTLRAKNLDRMFADGRELCMVTPGQSEELAGKLRMLLERPEMRTQMGSCAREAIERGFTWAAHTEVLRGLFRGMMD